MKQAETVQEWNAICNSDNNFFIRSIEDLNKKIQSNCGVFSKLTSVAIKEICDSVKFENGGLAHMSYSNAYDELGEESLQSLFDEFGLGADLVTDFKDYECEGSGTCAKKLRKICTSNCRG